MTNEQINKLLSDNQLPENSTRLELNETHISFVILTDQFAYKIKKPVHYSFLDFSTIEKRKYYCEKEIFLNNRFSEGVYLDVLPVCDLNGCYTIGGNKGVVIDYAVKMTRLEKEKQMDILLLNNKVTTADINNLAEKIANFHIKTAVIYEKDFMDIQEAFNDLEIEKEYLSGMLESKYIDIINRSIKTSNNFIKHHKALLLNRLHAGFFRDCHGDLHSRNIFLLPEPLPFDCIEFNDDFRKIDVLNEVAFLCMDLDSFDRQDLSALFIDKYNQYFPAMIEKEDKSLFVYYKSYRANIRAKVNSLRAKSNPDISEKNKALDAVKKYLQLMDNYLSSPELLL